MAKGTSFIESVSAGIRGYAKGLLVGGATGAVAGAVVGAIAVAVTGGGLGLAALGAGALTGALSAGAAFAAIGAIAGLATDVVRSREKNQVSAEDVTNVANIAFAQGLAMGHDRAMNSPETSAAESRKFREMIEQQRAQSTSQGKSIH
ncbi:MAG: hypothetical protein ACN2B6_02730 [Rickettsiales bacterium]